MNFKKEELDFSNQKLKDFPEEIFLKPKLRKLSLRNNEIKKIPSGIEKLKYLEMIDLSGNQISNLYAKLFELPNLKILILNNNQIVSIPKQISKLSKLKILNIAKNKLVNLPEEIKELKNLEELNLGENAFERFPWQIFPLSKLKTLWLAKNEFKDFPIEEIQRNFKNLKRLYCYGYKLDSQDYVNSNFLEISKIKGNSFAFFKSMSDTTFKKKKEDENNTPTVASNVTNTSLKNKIFISYSHQDKHWLDRVLTNLRVLTFEGVDINVWSDTRIKAGSKWKDEIEKELDMAYIVVVLVSTSFLASEFVRQNELPPLLKNAMEKGTKILPLILSPCRFTKTKDLSDFQSVNDPNEPISECDFSKQERILVKLTNDVEDYIANFGN